MKTLDHRFRSSKADGPDATQVQPSNWNDGHVFTGGGNGHVLTRDTSDANYGATWSAIGVWADVPFNAANFYMQSGGTWTVPSVSVQRFMVIGKTLRYHVHVPTSTIAGAGNILVINLPAGYTIGAELTGPGVNLNDNPSALMGLCFGSPGATGVSVAKLGSANFTAGAAFGLFLEATIEIA